MAGLCINPHWIPKSAELSELRPTLARSILYELADLDRLLAHSSLMVTLNNECREVNDGGSWAGWEDAVRYVAESGPANVPTGATCVRMMGIGNEFDAYWHAASLEDPPREDVPPEFAADLIRRASPILRDAGIKVVATSVVSPRWTEYLDLMMELCAESVDYVDLHAYGQRPVGWKQPGWGNGELVTALQTAHRIAVKPVIMSEIGITIEMAEGESGVAAYMRAVDDTVRQINKNAGTVDGVEMCPFWAWFAWCDQIGAPEERGPRAFGLLREDGSKRPAWSAFSDINDIPLPPPDIEEHPMRDAQIGGQTLTAEELHAKRWQLHAVPPLPQAPEYHHDFGIETAWRQPLNTWWGSPVTVNEDRYATGNGDETLPCRVFTNAVVVYRPDGSVEVLG